MRISIEQIRNGIDWQQILTAYLIVGIISIIWMFLLKEKTAGGLIGFLIYNMVLAVNKARQCIICEGPMSNHKYSKKRENRISSRYITCSRKCARIYRRIFGRISANLKYKYKGGAK